MKIVYLKICVLIFNFLFLVSFSEGQFRNTYGHNLSDDHTALIKKHDGLGYVQASTTQMGTKDIHLMKFDALGNVMLDETFNSPTNDEFALDVCLGNGNTFLICGYETVGGLDLGFVMSVDSSFNFLNKIYIQVPGNTKHTPALKIINSAFYEQNTPGNYWPGDPLQGYLVVGFEAVGYGNTQSKSAYAIKLNNALSFVWARKFDSPISAGMNDWDMCSNANWIWIGSFGYVIGGSGTSPSGEQAAMATLLTTTGSVVWSQLYADNNVAGTWCVAADGAYDDAEFELYQLVNFSQTQSGGIVALNQFTGAINPARTRYLISPNNDYYTYEFGSSCASQDIFISGYGHNQISGTTQGIFPFVLRYNKNSPQVDPWGPHFAYPTQSINYNPSGTIFSTFSTSEQPRIYYPKHWAARTLNVWSVAGFEDIGTNDENHLIHPYFDGKDSCDYIDPQINPVPFNFYTHPLNNAVASYNLPTAVNAQASLPYNVYNCCPVDANFTYTVGANCTYTFTATAPGGLCSSFTIKDMSNNIIASSAGTSYAYTFTSNGNYIVCFADCAPNGGTFCRRETCQTISVNCVVPCGTMNADFSFTISGCAVSVTDLTPDGDPGGCETWTFGGFPTVFAVDATTFTFPNSGTYTICHTDCCINSADGLVYTHTICKTVTVSCTPPCCVPINFTVTGSNCCRTFTPVWASGACVGTNFFWNFGDGNISWAANPTHCYAGSGMYTITMVAWCNKFTYIVKTKTIKVKCALPPPPPCCTGTSKIAYSNNGLLLNAQDASTYTSDVTPCCHIWNWGDGTSTSSEDASHYYTLPGTYDVSHTVTFNSSTGTTMSHTASQAITVNITPPCMCAPDHVYAFAGAPVICSASGHGTSLHVIDYEAEANMTYQWMSSATSGGTFTEMPGVSGIQTWIENVNDPIYLKCRCTCNTTGAAFYTEEVSLTDGHFDATGTVTPANICIGGSSTVEITSAGATSFEWQPNVTTSNVATVSPVTTTEYSVLALNNAGCGALVEQFVVVDNCTVPSNDSPATATNVAYSSNMNYPNCYPITGDVAYANDSPESSGFTGPDNWYKFVAQSTGVSITVDVLSGNDVIVLYQKIGSNYVPMPGGAEDATSGPTDFERLNYQGLTPGTTYYVSVGTTSGSGGVYSMCIQNLMPSGCAYSIPVNGFSLCGSYKAIYRGSAASGVMYSFNFTGTGGGAPLVTTALSGTNGLINLSNPLLALRYGGVYNVSVDVNYALVDGSGTVENIMIPGSTTSNNCTGVTITSQPLIQVKLNQRCPATLLRSNYLIGTAVPGNTNACSAVNYTYEFTQVVSCSNASPVSVTPAEYTTSGSTPYLQLGVLPYMASQGAWGVRIRPNFLHGPGVYGPSQLIRVNNTSASVMLPDEQILNDTERVFEVIPLAAIYPNPNKGDILSINLTDVQSDDVYIQMFDEMGRSIYRDRFVTDGVLNTIIVFETALSSGVYYMKFVMGDTVLTERLVVQKN